MEIDYIKQLNGIGLNDADSIKLNEYFIALKKHENNLILFQIYQCLILLMIEKVTAIKEN